MYVSVPCACRCRGRPEEAVRSPGAGNQIWVLWRSQCWPSLQPLNMLPCPGIDKLIWIALAWCDTEKENGEEMACFKWHQVTLRDKSSLANREEESQADPLANSCREHIFLWIRAIRSNMQCIEHLKYTISKCSIMGLVGHVRRSRGVPSLIAAWET